MVNETENETENKKIDHKDMTSIDLGLFMDTNILNLRCISL